MGWAWGGCGANHEEGKLRLIYSKLLVWGMHGVAESTSLNWLFSVSCMVLVLLSCIRGSSDSLSGEHHSHMGNRAE